ncbi:GWT1-domain-containing protein, partial [Cylindrobasidium torrendii FP15055 ss-10]
MSDYKSEKEAFVSGAAGSSVAHINVISLCALVSIIFYNVAETRLPKRFLTSWSILILPLILSMTFFANIPIVLASALGLLTFAISYLPRKEIGTPLPSGRAVSSASPQVVPKSPAVTTYRSHMMLMTVVAILAVDFPLFPRNLAKCETFGVSLMDIGVGSFVFSQGVVNAIPLIKNPAYLADPLPGKVITICKKVFPLFILGFLRVLAVKGTDYPEHESEYGTHWNFFLTMAFVPIFETLFHPLILRVPISMLAVLAALLQQALLGVAGFQAYALHAPRVSLISANKEGLVSLPGYVAIYLFGLSTGTLVLPSTPSYFRRTQRYFWDTGIIRGGGKPKPEKPKQRRKTGKAITELLSYTFLWWCCMGITRAFWIDGSEGVSRRVVNLSYIFWIAAYNTSFLLGYMALDMFFFPQPPEFKKRRSWEDEAEEVPFVYREPEAPALLTAINNNSLAVFLLANVMTGVVNLATRTMYASDAWAMGVLCFYTMAISAFAWVFRGRRLVKF